MPNRKKKALKQRKKTIVPKSKRDTKSIKHGRKSCTNTDILNKCPHNKVMIYDNGGVKRNKSPVRFTCDLHVVNCNHQQKANSKLKYKVMEQKNEYRYDGLSPKEKCYIITNCQAKSSRYQTLKGQAAQAIRESKIFSVYGYCPAVRAALLDRGWVEKLPQKQMNLSKIKNGTYSSKPKINGELERLLLSNFLEKYPPNFVWQSSDELRDTIIDMSREYPTIINKLTTDALWTSKQGLCSSMKRNYWFYIEDVAEVIGPRSYNTSDPGEIEDFIKDYKITACTSLLKWVVSMVTNERPVFVDSGKISMNVMLFAMKRCKEYLYRKENMDIDKAISNTTTGQWNTFLKKYFRIIGKDDVFQTDTENKLPLYMAYAKFLLQEMHKYRPQLSCEGCHNIWIIKPAHNSRGRGIRMASRLGVITSLLNKANTKYVIQKYIEEPLLIHETKFDIRQYCLVTSTYPLVIWMYKDCYLKFSSQKYNLKNYHESIHLTNNAVQRKYTNCEGRHEELPTANMWDSDKYKDYLHRIDKGKVWDKIIYPGMKQSIVGIMLSCQDSLPVCKNRFELYGCDFILDKKYKPWLIEINSNPDLNHTTPVTAKICPAVLSDVIKVVIDHARDRLSPTGKFECIYQQPMTIPRYGGALDLYVKGCSLRHDYFYKGNIDLKESYDYDQDIDTGYNIKSILDKIRQAYDAGTIMIEPEPEDDSHAFISKEQETSTHRLRSDYELSVAATVVTGQLDELMDRIVSAHNLNLKSRNETCSPAGSVQSPHSVKSVNDLSSIINKSSSRLVLLEGMNIINQDLFKFSKLDDEPVGKGSAVGDNAPKNILNDSKNLDLLRLFGKGSQENSMTTSLSTEMMKTTTKIINFINKKEREYSTETQS